jgi:hypothetical protein
VLDIAAFTANIIWRGGRVLCGWETKKKVGLLCLLVKFGISSFEPLDFNTRRLVTHLICVQKVLAIPLLVMGHFVVLPNSST